MKITLTFHPEVKFEVAATIRWYDQSRAGLGHDFESATERVLDAITDNPLGYGVVHLDIREGLLAHFPYVDYYRVLRNCIRVVAVCHTSRDPSVWQTRL